MLRNYVTYDTVYGRVPHLSIPLSLFHMSNIHSSFMHLYNHLRINLFFFVREECERPRRVVGAPRTVTDKMQIQCGVIYTELIMACT